MRSILCTFIAGAATVLAAIVMLIIRPPERNGFISEGGAFILTVVGALIIFFPVFWFPSMLMGYFVAGKNLSETQKQLHIVVTVISAIAFVGMICFVGGAILHHP